MEKKVTQYSPSNIEPKWQEYWEKQKTFRTKERVSKPKYYVLDFFPYPSGFGLSVGHCRNYLPTDTLARYKKMKGFNVLHPMGWDGFGLPAENYALLKNKPPQETTAENIANYKRQLRLIGCAYDLDREINSTNPDYYKWTQWLFLLLYKKGLVYRAKAGQWWCPSCKTILANEQVENNRCWRCNSEVEKKELLQWYFKITDYADRLLDDLKTIDWPEKIKKMQEEWIGKSTGAIIKFPISNSQHSIDVFTTRPDTLFGATYMVLAPEHPLVASLLKSKIKDKKLKKKIKDYIDKTKKKREIERTSLEKEKTGVFTGEYAVNPVNNQKIPIWIADYVLPHYGTGAIMCVPAHDRRDFEFAIKYRLPIISVIKPKNLSKSVIVGDSVKKGLEEELKKNGIKFETGLSRNKRIHIQVMLRDNQIQKYIEVVKKYLKENWWVEIVGSKELMIFNLDGRFKEISNFLSKQNEVFVLCRKLEPLVRKFGNLWETFEHNLFYQDFICYEGDGLMFNSGKYSGLTNTTGGQKIVTDLKKKNLAKPAINYKLRDWLVSRQRYWGAPIPIIYCPKCGIVPVPEKDLPVALPRLKEFKPSGTGKSPLANNPDFVKTKCPKCGASAERETDTLDSFVCSSWYFLRFADPKNKHRLFDKKIIDKWLPVDLYVGGAEHAVMHLLYARFLTKVLADERLIDFQEFARKLINQGIVLAPDGQKMSKSKENVITPDEVVKKYGADSLRLYELFIAPFEQEVVWQEKGIIGCWRFLNKIWNITNLKLKTQNSKQNGEIQKELHKTIKKVTEDLENLKFNTAVAALMEWANLLSNNEDAVNKEMLDAYFKLLAPFAPHFAEELWSRTGHKNSIFEEPWPKYDFRLIKEEKATIVIQINGRMRDKIEVAAGAGEEEIKKSAQSTEKIKKWLSEKKIKKFIYVPGRLVNIVT